MLWLVMPSVGSCRLQSLSGPGPAPVSPISISAPVGQGPKARNLPEDVRTIQSALNQVTAKGVAGGPVVPLAVDGICGPKTNAAIVRFQQTQLGWFDGVIEPGKNTIAKLNAILAPAPQVSEEDLRAKVRQALPIVAQAIAAALRNLQAVIASGPALTGLAADAADRLNRHFRLDTLSPSAQSTARIDLFRMFVHYSAVLVDTTAIAIDAVDEFDLDRTNPKKALTRGKGFFSPDEVDPDTGKRLDRIHLGLGFFAPEVTPEFGAFIILHEMAHFIGHPDGRFVEDQGRGWFTDIFIKPLSADQRLTNADSYAGFAHECRVENKAKPPFVQAAPGGLGGAR